MRIKAATRLVGLLMILAPPAARADVGDLLRIIANPDPQAGDQFGFALAASGRRLLSTAAHDDVVYKEDGSAYLVAGKSGTPLAWWNNPAPAVDDSFGRSAAAAGDQFLVGTWKDDNQGAVDTGSAYLYNQTGALRHTFVNPTPATDDRFGWGVGFVGSDVLISAYKDDTRGADTGAAHLFDSTSGQLVRSFYDPTPTPGDRFGYAVAGWSASAVIGCYRESSQTPNSGAVYLFDAGTGQLVRSIFNPAPGGGDLFGKSLAVVGDKILVGAPEDDAGGIDAGAAYLFDASSGQLLQTFLNPSPDAGDEFAWSVAAVGDNVLIGAPGDDNAEVDAGIAYLFDGATGALLATLHNPEPTFKDSFGGQVVGMVDEIVVSSAFDNLHASAAGTVYVFQGPRDTSRIPGDGNNDGLVTGADYTLWANGFGQFIGEARWTDGDYNDDGFVTGADFTVWADEFTGTPIHGVPEPVTRWLVAIAATASAFWRRLRSCSTSAPSATV